MSEIRWTDKVYLDSHGNIRCPTNTDKEDESKGDLISREGLKEQFDDIVGEYTVSEIRKLIDNAPTVEIPEKPTGKWIFHKDYNESFRYGCNQCGTLNNIPGNFCPTCGAKMKKEAENE